MYSFNVTYDIVTPESAELGDSEERGFIAEAVPLRSALRYVNETRTCHVGGRETVEPDCWPHNGDFRSIYVTNSTEYLTGASETRALHIPDGVTPSTRKRILRLAESARY